MSWIETVTQEGFKALVREALRPELEDLGRRLGDVEQRVARLEGAIDGSMRAYESRVEALFERFRSEVFQHLLEHKPPS